MRIVLLSIFIVMLSLSACSQQKGPSASTKSEMTDSDLEKAVEAKLNSDEPIRAAQLGVDANADRNTVTLSGTVESEAARSRAVELAKSARPGIVVEDKIDVKPRELTRADYTEEHAQQERARAKESHETVGNSVDDAWLHFKIVSKLIADSQTPERKINVDVNNAVVTLRGTVGDAPAKSEAERIAMDTEGVKRVQNQIKVAAAKTAR